MVSAGGRALLSRSRGPVAFSLALVLVGALPGAAAAADTVAFTLRDPRITESSGLARDEAGGIYWTANDSGSQGVVFGVGPDGRVRGTLNYRAQPRDVEAVAVLGNLLYAADIGDNGAVRDSVSVYYFTNPRASGLTVTYNSFDFRYPDGPHDAETLLVDESGRLSIVTKGLRGGIYVAPRTPSRTAVNELRRVGDAPALVTDGVFLPGGTQIALLTYGSVVVVDATTYQQVSSQPLPALRQAESIAVNLAGDGLLVGSEGSNSNVYALPLPPGAAATAPSAGPAPTATAQPGSGQDAAAQEDAAPDPRGRGTYLAVGLAGLVALVAGVVVAAVRRPADVR